MPEERICPLFLIFYKTQNVSCIEELCELWSPEIKKCCIWVGMSAIVSVSEAINRLCDLYDLHHRTDS